MPKPRFTISILVLMCWLCLDISIQAQTKDAKAGTATISGRVTLNGEPVANVVVALQNPLGSSSSPGIRVKTDGAGQFRFTGVTAGRYVLGALAPGFVSPSDRPQGPQGSLITVSEGENMDGVGIELKRGAAIAGRVTDSRRRAIAEEPVILTKLDEQGRPQLFNIPMNSYLNITDDRGYYRLFGLPAGRYRVSVGHRAQEYSYLGGRRVFYPQTFHPDATEESKAEVIELSEGGEATGVDITVAESMRAYLVSGRIVDAETGKPVAMMDVGYVRMLADSRSAGGAPSASRSDANGGFQFSLPPGKYLVYGGWANNDYFTDNAPVEVEDKDISGVDIKARRGATISGVVTMEGAYDRAVLARLPSLTLYARRSSVDDGRAIDRSGRINPDGGFRISGLPPGKITFSLSGQNDGNKFSILRIERGGVSQGHQIEIGAGEQAHYLRVVLVYGVAAIRGQLKIIGSSAPSDIVVQVYAKKLGGDEFANTGSQVDASGQFVIEGLTAGEYDLRLSYTQRNNSAETDPQLRQRFLQQLFQNNQRVSVGATGVTKVTFTLDMSRKEGQ
ncbi:MAG TPA: carboxypeptidase-like regulatory domain-containing protein [Blastocatellia bacterium]|nr:carboxypeptidase-like regulatory domain-containing protein [Blastocatellia bacterium]